MKFNRIVLRDAVQRALDADRAAYDAKLANREKEDSAHQRKWVEKYRAEWNTAAAKILASHKLGTPVTKQMLPREKDRWREDIAVYQPPRNNEDTYCPDQALQSLAVTLDAISEDEVTPTGLRTLGFTSATLQRAIRELGRVRKVPDGSDA